MGEKVKATDFDLEYGYYEDFSKNFFNDECALLVKSRTVTTPLPDLTQFYYHKIHANGYIEVHKEATAYVSGFNGGYRSIVKKGILDSKGNEVLPIEYDSISIFSHLSIPYASVKLDGKWSIINLENQKKICPFIYDAVGE